MSLGRKVLGFAGCYRSISRITARSHGVANNGVCFSHVSTYWTSSLLFSFRIDWLLYNDYAPPPITVP
jgi:hypothetical protein